MLVAKVGTHIETVGARGEKLQTVVSVTSLVWYFALRLF